jgi:hypothetical protein
MHAFLKRGVNCVTDTSILQTLTPSIYKRGKRGRELVLGDYSFHVVVVVVVGGVFI